MEKLLGKYEIINTKVIDEDRNIEEYKCCQKTDTKTKEYIIKSIRKEDIDYIHSIHMKEIEDLHHQNILNSTIESENDIYYIIYEYSQDAYEDISDVNLIEEKFGSRNLTGFFKCFIQVCNALLYIHNKGIYHGDISYDTILTNTDDDYHSYLLDMSFNIIHKLNNQQNEFMSSSKNNPKENDIYALSQVMLNKYEDNEEIYIYNEDEIKELMKESSFEYEKNLFNLYLNMVNDEPITMQYVKDKLENIYKDYTNNTPPSDLKIIPIKFMKNSSKKFLKEFEYDTDYEIDYKINELNKGRISFKETNKNYVIILSDYIFLCSKDKGIKDGYFFIVDYSKVQERDYNGSNTLSNYRFYTYDPYRCNNYADIDDFIKEMKSDDNKENEPIIKREEHLLETSKDVLKKKKINYACYIDSVDKARDIVTINVNDNEKYIIHNKKYVADKLEEILDEKISYNKLEEIIIKNEDDILENAESDDIIKVFDDNISEKRKIKNSIKSNDDIILSNDKGKEYHGVVIEYTSDTKLKIKLNEHLYDNIKKNDEFNICYDFQVKEIILNKQEDAFNDIKKGSTIIDNLMDKIINPKRYLQQYLQEDNLNNIENNILYNNKKEILKNQVSFKNNIEKLEYKNNNLDDNQKEAVIKALNLQNEAEILLIQGPPGTGKTTVITEIVHQILKERDSHKKILVASQSNQAVDNVLEKIHEDYKVLRIGKDENKMTNIAKKYAEKKVLETIINKNMKAIGNNNEYYNILSNLSKNIDDISNKNSVLNYFIKPIQVIFGTLIGISGWRNFRETVFDYVIIDEAGRALLSELAVPIRKAKHIILVGDQKQLAPVIDEEIKEDIQKKHEEDNYYNALVNYELFGDLYSKLEKYNKTNLFHFLNHNYRAHSSICDIYSTAFYDGKLETEKNNDIKKQHGLTLYNKSVVLINTSNCKERFEQQAGTGKINKLHVNIINNEIEKILKELQQSNITKTIGIITPYEAQKKYIEKQLKTIIHDAKKNNILIDIGTVDSFQGSDRDYIIYDSVRSSTRKSRIDFISDEKRLNVSLSRAKELLIIIADKKFLELAGNNDSKWPDILKIIDSNKEQYEIKEWR